MSSRRLAATVVLAATAGCAFRTPAVHVPPCMPAITVTDADVRVVVVRRGDNLWTAEQLRPWAVDILAQATQARGAPGSPARVLVRVAAEDELFWMKACPVICLFPALLGVDAGYVTIAVDVTIDTREARYVGHGRARKWGSLYAPAGKRALAAALDRALAQALRVAP